jgi:hypothetical protein
MYRIINNENIFGISRIEHFISEPKSFFQYGKQYRIYKDTNIYTTVLFSSSHATKEEIFDIEFTNKHIEILESKDVIIVEMFVRCIYNKYIKEIEDIQARKFYHKECFKCDI